MATPHIALSSLSPKFEGLHWQSQTGLKIGRLQSVEIMLDHPSVSRRHAEILLSPEGWVIQDLGSSNGTYLNDARVGRAPHRIRLGDGIRCGDILMRVQELVEPAQAQAKTQVQKPPEPAMPRLKTSGNYVRLKAISQNSWEDAVNVLSRQQESTLATDQRFKTLVRAGYHLCNSNSLEDLLQSILNDIVGVLKAQRGSIILADEITGHYRIGAVCSPDGQDENGRFFSKTLVLRSFSQGQSLLCVDAAGDQELRSTGTITRGTMSSIICALLRTPRRRLGVLHLDRSPTQPAFNQNDFYLADAIAASVSTGIESAQLIELQREQAIHTVTALAQAVEMRDQYTGGHTQRVTTYALLLADELKVSPAEYRHLRIGTPLHDIGKIGINDAILRKPGKLTPSEYEQMKTHTLKGAAIIESIPHFASLLPIIRHHHERWDGSGYPDKLSHDQISPLARIVAVADAFDAMTSSRPYRPAMPLDWAFNEIRSKAGTHFDPNCVDAFLRSRSKIEAILHSENKQLESGMQMMQTFTHAQLQQIAEGA